MSALTTTLGGLRCHVFGRLSDGQPPRLAVVLCHGFGAPGTDLVGLAPESMRQQRELAASARFYFPEAPLSLAQAGMPGGRAWWMIDLAALNTALETGGLRDLRNDHPAELPAARQKLMALVGEVRAETGLPMSSVVLGGFSQGSMLATDVSMRLPEPPAMLAVFSGSLLAEDDWRKLAAERGPLKVLQSHGREDMVLPYQTGEWLRDLFTDSDFEVEFLPFHGPHTIPPEALQRFSERLTELAE